MNETTKTKLDETVIKVLRNPITKVWALVGADTMENAKDQRIILSNKDKIECCVLSDALKYEGKDPEANNLFETLIGNHGYETVIKFLTEHIHL